MSIKTTYKYLDEQAEKTFDADTFVDMEPGIKIYDKALVHPFKHDAEGFKGGVILPDGSVAEGTAMTIYDKRRYDPELEAEEYVDEDVLWLGCFFWLYGHMITDGLKNLWHFVGRKDIDYKKVVYIADNPPTAAAKEMFSLLGIDISAIRRVTKRTRFRSVSVPDACFLNYSDGGRGHIFWSRQYRAVIDAIIDGAVGACPPKPGFDKIYFTRTGLGGYKDYNEESIERELRRLGFKIISPEKLPMKEQISLMQSCSVFAATEGSISHSAMFCREGTTAVLLRKALQVNAYSHCINQLRGLDAVYIDCHLSILTSAKDWYAGPFFVYPNKFFCEYFGLERKIFPFRDFKKYWRDAYRILSNGWREAPYADCFVMEPAYREVLVDEIGYAWNRVGEMVGKLRLGKLGALGRRAENRLRKIVYFWVMG